MTKKPKEKSGQTLTRLSTSGVSILPSMDQAGSAGCGFSPDPTAQYDKPGYRLMSYVDSFIQTPSGPVPRIKTVLDTEDRIATGLVRCGINRYRYTVVPGLYAVGNPDAAAEVLVTANFKLTFDHLR